MNKVFQNFQTKQGSQSDTSWSWRVNSMSCCMSHCSRCCWCLMQLSKENKLSKVLQREQEHISAEQEVVKEEIALEFLIVWSEAEMGK